MISVEEALDILKKNVLRSTIEEVDLSQALDLILAEDLTSPINMPPFDNSAMDGYALNMIQASTSFEIIGEIQAGSKGDITLESNQAVRIFTGALVPKTANTVIQQEWAKVEGNQLTFDREIETNKNIRREGEQIKAGAVAMKKGQLLNPAAIGFLAGLGIEKVNVYSSPKVAVYCTGDELIEAGNTLEPGQIYESNGKMLIASLAKYGFHNTSLHKLPDDFNLTYEALNKGIKENDIVLVSGGISVGDYDYVGKAFQKIGVEEVFYKVKQKPGKPLFAGNTKDTFVFGLPGNPASTLSCFYNFVLPYLNQFKGGAFKGLRKVNLTFDGEYSKKGERAEFLKAIANENSVSLLGHQSSAMLDSFAISNCLIYIDKDIIEVKNGDTVPVFLID
ncbi:MAG: molybdopterin molybdotransferase MoeA [Crocinitomicaceae bacterium]|nr:molybdopterin molybdotransferase MoeA [Crocinitomicaceae bacterium]